MESLLLAAGLVVPMMVYMLVGFFILSLLLLVFKFVDYTAVRTKPVASTAKNHFSLSNMA